MEEKLTEIKRTNLDTAEAEYLYANVLVECNKYKSFQKLAIPERNNLIDELCLKLIKKANTDANKIEAVSQEIFTYKLSEEEERKFYSSRFYIGNIEKPNNFEEMLKTKYEKIIKELVKEIMK